MSDAKGDDDKEARDQAFTLVYQELRALARSTLRRRGVPGHDSCQQTALVHETYIRLMKKGQIDWKNRGDFFPLAARAMRDFIVDRTRNHLAKKRRHELGQPIEFVEEDAFVQSFSLSPEEILTLNTSLLRLSDRGDKYVAIVELRFFAGFKTHEIAEKLQISKRTVERRWQYAQAFLRRDMGGSLD